MSVYYTSVSSNTATINNFEAVQAWCENYDVEPELDLVEGESGSGTISLLPESPSDASWPSALRVEELPDVSDFEDEDGDIDDDGLFNAEDTLRDVHGRERYSEFLAGLAPFLTSSFIIQAASFDSSGEFFGALQWTARPCANVEFVEIAPLANISRANERVGLNPISALSEGPDK